VINNVSVNKVVSKGLSQGAVLSPIFYALYPSK